MHPLRSTATLVLSLRGFSDPAQTSYGALNDTVYWGRHDDITLDEGFVHMGGPCEVWCDDNRAQQDMNCQVTYTPNPARAPPPFGSIALSVRMLNILLSTGSPCTVRLRKFTEVLMLTYLVTWGFFVCVVINCVNINSGSGGRSSSSKTATTTTSTSATSPNTSPTTTTGTPTTPGSDEEIDTTKSQATSPSPTIATRTETPGAEETNTAAEASTTTQKCNVRRRTRVLVIFAINVLSLCRSR
ncbi:unnamed protein product [Phytophthora fragariaefolia]|uniref:Unnamed protein product n=1 Tax=Phytophthora fragariaefolia TaxID=1490495 RepID=A0A9W6XQQ8_9STRA|nr:unnamed protein product [Phytophthora fragariaefolia]